MKYFEKIKLTFLKEIWNNVKEVHDVFGVKGKLFNE